MTKKFLIPLLLSLLLLQVASIASAATDYAWNATYWNGIFLDSDEGPALVRQDRFLNFNWGKGRPANIKEQFAARWTRTVDFQQGTYIFTTNADDRVRVWVDGVKLIDAWYQQDLHTDSNQIFLTEGAHHIRVEYVDLGGEAIMQLNWVRSHSAPQNDVNVDQASNSTTDTGTWNAEYFSNTNLRDAPTITRQDSKIDFDWGFGSPDPALPENGFSARWTKTVNFNQPGRYQFTATVDDGIRVWVGDEIIINKWTDRTVDTFVGQAYVAGNTPIKVEYREGRGQAVIQFSWNLAHPTGPNSEPAQKADTAPASTGKVGTIAVPQSLVLRMPHDTAPVIATARQGDDIRLAGTRSADSQWVRIITPFGIWGWVPMSDISTDYPIDQLQVWQ